jgi:hypothetical protein
VGQKPRLDTEPPQRRRHDDYCQGRRDIGLVLVSLSGSSIFE